MFTGLISHIWTEVKEALNDRFYMAYSFFRLFLEFGVCFFSFQTHSTKCSAKFGQEESGVGASLLRVRPTWVRGNKGLLPQVWFGTTIFDPVIRLSLIACL